MVISRTMGPPAPPLIMVLIPWVLGFMAIVVVIWMIAHAKKD